jgi:hypothetical protein
MCGDRRLELGRGNERDQPAVAVAALAVQDADTELRHDPLGDEAEGHGDRPPLVEHRPEPELGARPRMRTTEARPRCQSGDRGLQPGIVGAFFTPALTAELLLNVSRALPHVTTFRI